MNRKAYFSAGLLYALGVLAPQAGVTDPCVIRSNEYDDSELILPRFLKGDDAQLLFRYNDQETGVTSFSILDSKLNEIAHFSSEAYPEVTAVKKSYRSIWGPSGVYETNVYDNFRQEEITEEMFFSIADIEGYTRREDHDGEIWMFYDGGDEWGYVNSYFEYEVLGTRYPRRIYLFKDNTFYERIFEYACQGWEVLGYDEDHPREQTVSRRPQIVSLDGRSDTCGDMDIITVTQTLFNEDEDYEWVIPIYSVISVSEENDSEKIEGEDVACTGFKIISNTGVTVAEVNFPSGYVSPYGNLEMGILIMGSDMYLCTVVKDDAGNYYDISYTMSDGSSVKQVGAPKRVSVSPRTPKKGTPVVVSLDNEVSYGSLLTVVSASGAVVMSRNIPAGMDSVEIDTNNMPAGMYIVNVNDGKTIREAAKIIIR